MMEGNHLLALADVKIGNDKTLKSFWHLVTPCVRRRFVSSLSLAGCCPVRFLPPSLLYRHRRFVKSPSSCGKVSLSASSTCSHSADSMTVRKGKLLEQDLWDTLLHLRTDDTMLSCLWKCAPRCLYRDVWTALILTLTRKPDVPWTHQKKGQALTWLESAFPLNFSPHFLPASPIKRYNVVVSDHLFTDPTQQTTALSLGDKLWPQCNYMCLQLFTKPLNLCAAPFFSPCQSNTTCEPTSLLSLWTSI